MSIYNTTINNTTIKHTNTANTTRRFLPEQEARTMPDTEHGVRTSNASDPPSGPALFLEWVFTCFKGFRIEILFKLTFKAAPGTSKRNRTSSPGAGLEAGMGVDPEACRVPNSGENACGTFVRLLGAPRKVVARGHLEASKQQTGTAQTQTALASMLTAM